MWQHEIYGLFVTEDQLEKAMEVVRAYVLEKRPGERDVGDVRAVFRDAVGAGRPHSERHGDIHMDGHDGPE